MFFVNSNNKKINIILYIIIFFSILIIVGYSIVYFKIKNTKLDNKNKVNNQIANTTTNSNTQDILNKEKNLIDKVKNNHNTSNNQLTKNTQALNNSDNKYFISQGLSNNNSQNNITTNTQNNKSQNNSLDNTIINEKNLPPKAYQEFQIAIELRNTGDLVNSIKKLKAINSSLYNNPLILYEIAITYELLNQQDKANAVWQEIYQLGEKAGAFYIQARKKLQQDNTPSNDKKILSFVSNVIHKQIDRHGVEDLTVELHIMAKPKYKISLAKVRFKLILFDLVNGKKIDLTSAESEKSIPTFPMDWIDDKIEIVKIKLIRNAVTKGESPKNDEIRSFYGYKAWIYYDDIIQDFITSPKNFSKKDPLKNALPKDSSNYSNSLFDN